MPTYDFTCQKCGHHFSRILPMGSREAACPKCGAVVVKQISAPAVHFSGSGFYKSDSAQKPMKSEKKDPPAADNTPCANCPHNKE